MTISRKFLTIAGFSAAIVASNIATDRRWAKAPNPLGSDQPRFPGTDTIMVPTNDGAEIKVDRAGTGPTVVLVHGLTSRTDDWGPVADRLVASGHRVIGVNQRGHGGSTIGTEGFSAARQGRDLQQVFSALELTDLVLVGHSMGGIASMSYAVDHPQDFGQRVAGLCLVATLANTSDFLGRAGAKLVANRPSGSLEGDDPVSLRIRRRVARFVLGAKPSTQLIDFALDTAANCPDEARIGAALGLATYNVEDRLVGIDVPTTVLCGTVDFVTRYGNSVKLTEMIPGATLVTIKGAGHMVLWENPDEVSNAIAGLVPVPTPAAVS